MKEHAVNPVRIAKTLAQQKSDFTAEGSPPPGKVFTSTPVRSPEPKAAALSQRPVRRTITLKQVTARASR
jgi:hypothetical protein